MSKENEHVEGDEVEASRPVFKSNAEMLAYMNTQWRDDDYVDLLRQATRHRNAAAHFVAQQPTLFGDDVPSPERRTRVVFHTTPPEEDHVPGQKKKNAWRRRLARLRDARPARSMIATPPGSILLQVSRVFFGRRAHEEIFAQIVADMREEYFEALQRGAHLEAWIARARGTYAWIHALTAKVPHSITDVVIGLARKLIGSA